MQSFQEIQNLVVSRLEEEAQIIGKIQPVNLYDPIKYTLGMGGKRLRPIMVLMACDLFEPNFEEAIYPALAIEIFHNFTLLHDDIMDHADMRRNKPSVHKKYNENVAILSGDAMSIMAYQYLAKTNSEAYRDVMQLFSETAIQVCEGQQYDMDFEDRMDVSIDDYLNMIRLKTAVLIACSLKMGALIGGASNEDADLIYDFGINLGLAFQLQDDLLDVYADQDKFGKKIGGDIVANKKTFLLLKTLELSSGPQKEELLSWINKTDFDAEEKVKNIKKIYEEINVKSISEDLIESYFGKSLELLNSVSVSEKKKEQLLALAHMIMKRDY